MGPQSSWTNEARAELHGLGTQEWGAFFPESWTTIFVAQYSDNSTTQIYKHDRGKQRRKRIVRTSLTFTSKLPPSRRARRFGA